MSTYRTLLIRALIITGLAPGAALAQPADPPAGGTTTLVEQAIAAAGEHRYEDALALLRQADQAAPSPHLHYLMAVYLVELGRNGDALAEYDYVLAHADPADRERFEARQEIARIEGLVGILILDDLPAGASVTIDGKAAVATGRGFVVEPGPRTVSVTLEGRTPFRRDLMLAAGQTEHVRPDLPPLPVGGDGKPGDGEKPRSPLEGPGGSPAPAAPSFMSLHRRSLTVGAGAAGVALVGVGLAVWTQRDYADLAKTCAYTVLGCPQDRIDGVERKALFTNITLGVAAAGAIGAGVLYVLESRKAGRESSAVTVLPTGRGAAVSVRF